MALFRAKEKQRLEFAEKYGDMRVPQVVRAGNKLYSAIEGGIYAQTYEGDYNFTNIPHDHALIFFGVHYLEDEEKRSLEVNAIQRFDIGKVGQDLKECCHAILFASLGRRKRPNRHFAGRWAVDGSHCPGARSGAKTTISRELQRNALSSGGYSPLHAAGAYQLRRRREAILEREAALQWMYNSVEHNQARIGFTAAGFSTRIRIVYNSGQYQTRKACEEAALDSGAKRNEVKRSGFGRPFQARPARLGHPGDRLHDQPHPPQCVGF